VSGSDVPPEKAPRPGMGSPFGAYSASDLRALAYEATSRIANGGVLITDANTFCAWLQKAEDYIFAGRKPQP